MKTEDVLSLIQKGNTKNKDNQNVVGKLQGYRFYGFIQNIIPENIIPNYLKRLSKHKSDIWVSMQLVAIGKIDEISKNRENTSFVYGDIAILVSSTLRLGDWYQIDGVARTVLYDGTGDCCYISNMAKIDGAWGVVPALINDLNLDSVSKIIEQYIIMSAEKGLIILPRKVRGYTPVRAYEERYNSLINSVKVSTPEEAGEVILNIEEFKETAIPVESESNKEVLDRAFEEAVPNKVITKPSDNIEWREVKRRPKRKFTAVTRTDKAKKTKKYNTLVKIAKEADEIREENLDILLEQYDIADMEIQNKGIDDLTFLLDKIKSSSNRRPKGVGLSGQAIIKEYITNQEESSLEIDRTSLGDLILFSGVDKICKYMLYRVGIEKPVSLGLPLNEEVKKRLDKIFPTNVDEVYACLYAILIGAKLKDFKKTAINCEKAGLSFIEIIKTNPYLLILANSNMKFLAVETLANARGIHTVNEDWRLVCMLHDMLYSGSGSTAFDMYDLYTTKLNYTVGKLGLRRLQTESSLITEEAKANLKYYVDSGLTDSAWNYDSSNFNEQGVKILSKEELKRAIIAYVDVGLGTTDKGFLYNTQMLKKDIYIFDKLYKLAFKRDDIDKAKIGESIINFEDMKNKELNILEERVKAGKGYKLEALQADAVRLIDQNVACLTGPAGSGKTTTVEAMIYAREDQSTKDNLDIKFACPTGKAAKRLQEVVKQKVRTIHSMCGIYDNDSSEMPELINEDDNFNYGEDETDIYIFDESAMMDTNLMFKLLKKIKGKPQLFFLGDIEQLSAIGDGKPFADILKFLPTVALRVSKRSAEGSDISLNTKVVIENSDRNDFKEMSSGKDFIVVPRQDKDIPETILNICRYHLGLEAAGTQSLIQGLGTLKEEDIQVISPVNKDRYVWGCNKLNTLLQDLFNPMRYIKNFSITFGYSNDLHNMRVGSRVIHTENNYKRRHYSAVVNGKVYAKNKAGVMNGDMGYIVGVFDGNKCSEVEPSEGLKEVIDGREIEDIKRFFSSGIIIVAVKYYDPDEEADFYILYHGFKSEAASTQHEVVLSYSNLTELQLAYALTTHKMQGSQARLVICTVGSNMSTKFISRNMIYTMITRAQEGCYVIGNIEMMERGRLYESSSDRTTALEQLCEE